MHYEEGEPRQPPPGPAKIFYTGMQAIVALRATQPPLRGFRDRRALVGGENRVTVGVVSHLRSVRITAQQVQ